MKLCFDGNPIKQYPHRPSSIKKKKRSPKLKSIYTMALLILIGTVGIFWGLKDVNAQTTLDFHIKIHSSPLLFYLKNRKIG